MKNNERNDLQYKIIDGSTFEVNPDLLKSFPVDSLMPGDFISRDDYKIIDVIYQKPLGDQVTTRVTLVLTDAKGEYFNALKDIKFALSLNDKVAASISPSAFSLKPYIAADAAPERLVPTNFSVKHRGVSILSIEYKPPISSEKTQNIFLIVKINDLNSVTKVPLSINFAKTLEEKVLEEINISDFEIKTEEDNERNLRISSTKYIGKYPVQVIQSKIGSITEGRKAVAEIEIKFGTKVRWIQFPIAHNIPKKVLKMNHFMTLVKLLPEFLDGPPPIFIKPNFVKYPEELKLISMFYQPPKDFKQKIGTVDMLFEFKNELGRLKLQLEFKYSISEFVNHLKVKMNGSDFKYLREDLEKAPPMSIDKSDFECKEKELFIEKIDYNFKAVKPTDKEIKISIHTLYRGNSLIFEKIIKYPMSRVELMTSNQFNEEINVDAIQVPEILYDQNFIKELNNKTKTMPEKILSNFYIAPPYSFKVSNVRVNKFDDFSRDVEYIINLEEKYEGKLIKREVVKKITLDESYAEKLLMKWTQKDIDVNSDAMDLFPPERINSSLFIPNGLFNILSVVYVRPSVEERVAKIAVKIGAGKKTNIINKDINYLYSRSEYQKLLWDTEDKNALILIDPSKINIHANILGEPAEEIDASQITGVPEGVNVEVVYAPPPLGKAVAELAIILKKNKAERVLKQKLIFALPRTRDGVHLQRTHTVTMEVPDITRKGLFKKRKKIKSIEKPSTISLAPEK